MTKVFTQNDVLRYLYKETSAKENVEMEKQLLFNTELKDFYNEMKGLVSELNALEIEVSDTTINKILDYSKQVHLQFHP